MADWTRRNGARMSTEDMLERQNQLMTENLSNKVSRLKNLAFDIEGETKDQNKYILSDVDSDFDSGQGLLTGSMNRISHMIGTGKSNRKLMCYIILGLVILFVVCYYIISRIRS